MAELKTVTLRLPVAIVDYIANVNGINKGVIDAIETLMLIQSISMQELKGVLSSNEWKFLADSLNGVTITDAFIVSKDALIAHCEDAELYDGAATKWGVDVKAMSDKITKLSGAHIDAIYRRVEKFWDNPETDIEKWAEY